jgi:hypothetical protein
MFIGHYAVALMAKPAAKETSLGTLVAAGIGLDLVFPLFVFAGIETLKIAPGITPVFPVDLVHIPYSHSLLAALGWSALAGAAYWRRRRLASNALVVGLLVLSHWLLDAASHRPDMPLTWAEDTAKVGLGLWYSLPWTLAVEGSMLALGGWLAYKGGVPPKGLAFFLGFLVLVYLGAVFGPPPPSETAMAASGLGQWLLVWWAAKIDGTPRPS